MGAEKKALRKKIQEYLNYPWTYTIRPEEDYFVVYVHELSGVTTDGKTVQEAMINIKEAIECTIESMIEMGMEIPVPQNPAKYKGSIPYRTSSDVHYKLAMLAAQKHTSLNKTLDALVREALKREDSRISP